MTVVALVPAKDRADSVGATVAALRAVAAVDRVLVIDDGSTDATADAARAAGAEVLRLARNLGKAGAIHAGVDATPEADVYLLIDADVADTAAAAARLLEPVLDGAADLTVASLPPARGRAGFGVVKRMAAGGVARACGVRLTAPLSGQRAVRAELLRGLGPVRRFGLEVAMTIDAARAGARVVEVPLPMEHRHTGRTLAGFSHRARQGRDILGALVPRLSSRRARGAVLATVVVAVLAGTYVTGRAAVPSSQPARAGTRRIVLFGIPHLGLADVSAARMPNLDRLARTGAFGSVSVRTLGGRPGSAEAYATISAGARVRADAVLGSSLGRDDRLEGSSAAEVARRRTGLAPSGRIVVPAMAQIVRQSGADVSSVPGALGDALRRAGKRTAVVANSDADGSIGALRTRPAAIALATRAGDVDLGVVDAALLRSDPSAPFGKSIDEGRFVREASAGMRGADVTVVDPGETDRAYAYRNVTSTRVADQLRLAALARTDRILGALARTLPPGTRLLVVGTTPPTATWELTPVVAWGAGVVPGRLYSPSTKRPDLVTLTDIPPTLLDAVGVATPEAMVGQPLRFRSGPADRSLSSSLNKVAVARERTYYPMALTYIVVQALFYLGAIFTLRSLDPPSAVAQGMRLAVLTFAAWPLATFLLRIVPALYELGAGTHLLTWVLAAAIAAAAVRARTHPLDPLLAICSATVFVTVVDVATGGRLQMASILGYSPHTAARFTGLGNTAFAVLAGSTVIVCAALVARSDRPTEAWWVAAALATVVVVADGAPWLGSDVGGILSLVPVFGLTLYAMSGRRVTWRAVLVALAATAAVLALAVGADLLRPADQRSHLARFVVGSSGGGSTFWTTIGRKWATNVRVFQQSVWTWMVPITALFVGYVLVVARGWPRLLPRGSAVRAGVVGALAAGVLGWLVNDSGVVITALVFVYLGPYLTLLVLDGTDSEPVLLEPTGDAREVVAATVATPR